VTASLPPKPSVLTTPLVVIVGPTASGKTRLALELGRYVSAEVIGADSRQVYRWMNIGTAKPTAADQAALPHHLIDVVDPDEPFHLRDYAQRATAAIAGVRGRGRLPLLVGGSGQYVLAIVDGWQVPSVPPDPDLRASLAGRAERDGPIALHAALQEVDPDAAKAIHPNNVRRVIRALELIAQTNEPASAQLARRTPRADALVLGLRVERRELYRRIDARVEDMFRDGLVEEVEDLLRRGFDRSLPSLSGIGYTQVVQFLSGEISREDAVARVKTATHRLVRQQSTWFRADDPRTTWVESGDVKAALALVRAWKPRVASDLPGVTA